MWVLSKICHIISFVVIPHLKKNNKKISINHSPHTVLEAS